MDFARPKGILRNINWRKMAFRAIIAVVILIGLVYVFIFSKYGYIRRLELEREKNILEAEIADMQAENERLESEIDKLHNDEEAIERLAREELGLVKEGETVYRFVEAEEKEANDE